MEWMQQVTFGLALLGAVLGVVNTWRTLSRDRLRLRVRLVLAIIGSGQHQHRVGIEVTNLSTFPVTLNEVGLHAKGSKSRAVFIPLEVSGESDSLPCRLEPRTQVTAYILRQAVKVGVPYTSAYARTACGFEATHRQKKLLAYVSERN